MLFYVSSDLLTHVSEIVSERGLTWREVEKAMGKCGRSFRRQMERLDPNPCSAAFFCCLRALKLELTGCRRVLQYTRHLNMVRRDAGLSFRKLAELTLPRTNHRTAARILTGQRTPRLHSLISLSCALDVHPEIQPSSTLARSTSATRTNGESLAS